ncbi:MAG TPA: hypothetical protein DFR83_08225 [Deltaproteobacteria bacterium]|nr:hypothetical protein [Deltaproteobacteria bacterium]
MSLLFLIASVSFATTPVAPQSVLNSPDRPYAVHFSAELGTLAVMAHRIQFSKSGTMIDYVEEGGQDNLFPYARLQSELSLGDRHSVVLLYQPLNLTTRARLPRDLVIDNATFEKGSGMRFRYGFDFYRGSWLYDLQEEKKKEFALGLSLQIRNATIDFEDLDGETFRANRDIGPVPVLKMRVRQPMGSTGAFWGFEADGFYAPIKYLNGSDVDVIGAILDTSARVGTPTKNGVDVFLNVRYIGGGAEGTSDDFLAPADGWVENWLHTVAVSVGTQLR